jgi:endonuclease/exonuclease/phosphatase family metal-dependent hydrolase
MFILTSGMLACTIWSHAGQAVGNTPVDNTPAGKTAVDDVAVDDVAVDDVAVDDVAVDDVAAWVPIKGDSAIRVATFNVSFNRPEAGGLARDLNNQDPQALAIAAVIRTVKPDIILLNEVDYADGQPDAADNAGLFERLYLSAPEPDALGTGPWAFPYIYTAPVNTGVPSGLDINQNGKLAEPSDAWGYGAFPGQYGMAVLSRFEIERERVRTMQNFLWGKLPGAMRPIKPSDGLPFYPEQVWEQLRLSSKSFWDVPIDTPLGRLHVLASHPTPPAFDGPEDYNGCRNHDEIRLIQYYIERQPGLTDDEGRPAGLGADAPFVVMGDLNSDPVDGDSRREAILDLLAHPRVAQAAPPASRGAVEASRVQGQANRRHRGPAETDTADFNDRSVGNLRVDYVLPSANFRVVQSGVFWLATEQMPAPLRDTLKQAMDASDHHLVWVDIEVAEQ